MSEEIVKELIDEIGDFCHEQYLGCSNENGIWNYGYKNEVVNMVADFFKTEKGQKFIS